MSVQICTSGSTKRKREKNLLSIPHDVIANNMSPFLDLVDHLKLGQKLSGFTISTWFVWTKVESMEQIHTDANRNNRQIYSEVYYLCCTNFIELFLL